MSGEKALDTGSLPGWQGPRFEANSEFTALKGTYIPDYGIAGYLCGQVERQSEGCKLGAGPDSTQSVTTECCDLTSHEWVFWRGKCFSMEMGSVMGLVCERHPDRLVTASFSILWWEAESLPCRLFGWPVVVRPASWFISLTSGEGIAFPAKAWEEFMWDGGGTAGASAWGCCLLFLPLTSKELTSTRLFSNNYANDFKTWLWLHM